MPPSDPWLWTVDELVAEVCGSNALYIAAGCSTAHIPDATTIENAVRNRQLTGKIFLTALDSTSLVVKNELNAPHLNQRMALLSVVELLQNRSHIFKQRTTTAGVSSLDTNSADHSPSVHSTRKPNNTVVTDGAAHKRKKITHLSTVPLRNMPSDSQGPSNTAVTSTSGPPPLAEDEFNYLLKWQNISGGDQIIDLPDGGDQIPELPDGDDQIIESPDEDEDELQDEDNAGLSDTAKEDSHVAENQDDDVVERPSKRPKLSRDEIVEIINERIEFYTNAWKPNKGVPRGEEVGYDPVTMWNEAEAKGEREALMQQYETEYAYFRNRLDRFGDEIVKSPGGNAKQVQQQCCNLELTINSMELAAWLHGIYKLGPVDDSDEELEVDDEGAAVSPDGQRPSQDVPAHQDQPSTEIIDLGSPSESSQVEDANASPFDNNDGTITDLVEDQFDVQARSPTRDSVIADSVEPIIYAQPDEGFSIRTPINHGDEPENASIATVRRWKWGDLVEHLDRKRVVSKALNEMKSDDRESIRSRIKLIGKTSLIKEIRACIDMFCREEMKLQGVLLRDMPKYLSFTKLFLSWWFCCNYAHGPRASKTELEELKECMDSGVAETSTFYDYVYTIMGTTFSENALQHPDQPSQAEIIEISDDD